MFREGHWYFFSKIDTRPALKTGGRDFDRFVKFDVLSPCCLSIALPRLRRPLSSMLRVQGFHIFSNFSCLYQCYSNYSFIHDTSFSRLLLKTVYKFSFFSQKRPTKFYSWAYLYRLHNIVTKILSNSLDHSPSPPPVQCLSLIHI